MQIRQHADENNKLVSLLRLKRVVSKFLPADSITRSMITSEPDELPLTDAISKFEVFDRLLVEELGSRRSW